MMKRAVFPLVILALNLFSLGADAGKERTEYILLALLSSRTDHSYTPLLIKEGKSLSFSKRSCPEEVSTLFWIPPPPPASPELRKQYGSRPEIYELSVPGNDYQAILSISKKVVGGFELLKQGPNPDDHLLAKIRLKNSFISSPGFQFVVSSGGIVRQDFLSLPQMASYIDQVLKLLPRSGIDQYVYLYKLRDYCQDSHPEFREPAYFAMEKLSCQSGSSIAVCDRKEALPYLRRCFKTKWLDSWGLNPWKMFWSQTAERVPSITFFETGETEYKVLARIQGQYPDRCLFVSRKILPDVIKQPMVDKSNGVMVLVFTDLGIEYYPLRLGEILAFLQNGNKESRNSHLEELISWLRR